MLLQLFHGRTSDQDQPTDLAGNTAKGWGFSGPVLTGISGLNQTYLDGPRLFFRTAADALTAHVLTGWGEIPDLDFDELEYEVEMHDNRRVNEAAGLIEANEMFYGDLSLREDHAIGELLIDEDYPIQRWFKIDGLLRLHTLNGIRDHGLDDEIDVFASEDPPTRFVRQFIRKYDLNDAHPGLWYGYDHRLTEPNQSLLPS